MFSGATASFAEIAALRSWPLPSGYHARSPSAPRSASIAFGEDPRGFSLEASLRMAASAMPSSRAVSAMGFPGT